MYKRQGETEYSEALKLGKKEYRARIAKGKFPYLPVLDEILSEADIQTEQNMEMCIRDSIIDSGKFDWTQNDKWPWLVEPNVSYHGVSLSLIHI